MDGRSFLDQLRKVKAITFGEESRVEPPAGDLAGVLADNLEPFLGDAPSIPYAMRIPDPDNEQWIGYIVMPSYLMKAECFRTESGQIANANLTMYPFDRITHVFSMMKMKKDNCHEWGGFALEFGDDRLEFSFDIDGPLRLKTARRFLAELLKQYNSFHSPRQLKEGSDGTTR